MYEYFLKYGKVFVMLFFFGKILNFVIVDLEMLKEIFVKEFDFFRDCFVSYMFVNLKFIDFVRYDIFV